MNRVRRNRSSKRNRTLDRLAVGPWLQRAFSQRECRQSANPQRALRRRNLTIQQMEERRVMTAHLPTGITPLDNGEVFAGTVTVTPVFFESNGSIDPSTEDWTTAEIEETLDRIDESLDWWSRLLATQTSVHTLDFVVDDTYSRQNRVSTGYEPISRSSDVFNRYVGDWLIDLGYGDAPSIESAVAKFNHAQRTAHETDWAFTIFVVDNSADDDGFFASGSFLGAFAYPGGLFIVIPSGRPVYTYAHEIGHIFWARDEYPGPGSWTDQRGYYNAYNLNASDNPTPGFVQEDSIMRGGSVSDRAFQNLYSPESTLAMIGWRDSDGDGIFDFADVPLQIEASGFYDDATGSFQITGSSTIDTLANENSAGNQPDFSMNHIDALQYRVDDGQWQTAVSLDGESVEFDFALNIDSTFDEILWRTIDLSSGVTSAIITGSPLTPAFSGLGGIYAYIDENLDNDRDAMESLLADSTIEIRSGDGSPLFYRTLDAALQPEGELTPPSGMTFSSEGEYLDGRISVQSSTTDESAPKVLHGYYDNPDDSKSGKWFDTWNRDQKLAVELAQTTGRVEIDFIATDTGGYGVETGSYARIEALDPQGNRIDRVTSVWVEAGQQDSLVIEDSQGRIAKVLVYGHAETEILVSGIRVGHESMVLDNHDGVFAIDDLADGDYTIIPHSPNLIYQFESNAIPLQISGGNLGPIALAADRVDSPRHNAAFPQDANSDQIVSARDALFIINDLARNGNRTLAADEATGSPLDVSNDGRITPIDALMVINYLARNGNGEGEEIEGPAPQPTGSLDTTQSFSSSQAVSLPQPISPDSVDRLMRSQSDHIPSDLFGIDRGVQAELNDLEGQQTFGQSLHEGSPDTDSGTGVNRTVNHGKNPVLQHLSLDLMEEERANLGDLATDLYSVKSI